MTPTYPTAVVLKDCTDPACTICSAPTSAGPIEWPTLPDRWLVDPEGKVPPVDLDASADLAAALRTQQQGIGDLNSTAKGSGARFNTGKAPMELIPLRIVADSLNPGSGEPGFQAATALQELGRWQETGEIIELHRVLDTLGADAGWLDCAHVFDYGKRKYAEWNWAKGMAWSIPLACAARHLMQMINGEENDAESGLPHRGHVFCNIVMLLTFIRTFPEGDDRPRCLA